VQVLVNNAAAPRRFELGFTGMTAEEFRTQVEVNVWAAWDLMLAALPGMRELGRGWVLNISSQGAAPKVGPPYRAIPMVGAQCLYGSTKAMLDRLTTGAAMELYDDGIAVNTLAPEGAVATENARTVAGVRDDWSEPMETMAEAALALCSGDPRELTGRVATSLSFLAEHPRPVRALDGRALVDGWQPGEIDPGRLVRPYLTAFAGPTS
jgi:NAD(P)-dependent dehydrogenase (short-subunit alcohol dehydrogenase family)